MPSRISSHQLRSWPRVRMPATQAPDAVDERPRGEQRRRAWRSRSPERRTPAPRTRWRARRAGRTSTTSGARPMVPATSKDRVIGSGRRVAPADGWRRRPRAAASRPRRPRRPPRRRRARSRSRLAVAAHLADVLERGGGDLVIAGRRGAGAEGLDASAHARRIRADAGRSTSRAAPRASRRPVGRGDIGLGEHAGRRCR